MNENARVVPGWSGLIDEAVLLAGGQGIRLRPLLPDVPKILAPVGGRPFLAYLLDQVESSGLRRAVILTGYKAQQVEDALGKRHGKIDLAYSREQSPLDTAGALRLALPLLHGQAVLVLNGDSYLNADIGPFLDWFAFSRPPAALVALKLEDTGRFGRLILGENGTVEAFTEKGQAGPGYINAGIYIFSRRILEQIHPGRPVSLERETFPALAGGGLAAYVCQGDFLDIGTPESYAQAGKFFAHD